MESEGSGIGQTIIVVGFWGGVLVYPILQIIALSGSKGYMRILALLPLAVMAIVFAVTIIGFVQESNLWPIFLIFTSPVAVIYLFVLDIIKQIQVIRGNE
jgi:hypothetical protein